MCVFQSHNFYKETIVKQSTNLIKNRKQWYVMCFWAKKALPLFDGKYELWNKICKWLSDLTDWVCAQQVVKFQVWSLHEGPSTLASPAFKAKLSLYLHSQSYIIKSAPWTILSFRILGIFSVENMYKEVVCFYVSNLLQ